MQEAAGERADSSPCRLLVPLSCRHLADETLRYLAASSNMAKAMAPAWNLGTCSTKPHPAHIASRPPDVCKTSITGSTPVAASKLLSRTLAHSCTLRARRGSESWSLDVGDRPGRGTFDPTSQTDRGDSALVGSIGSQSEAEGPRDRGLRVRLDGGDPGSGRPVLAPSRETTSGSTSTGRGRPRVPSGTTVAPGSAPAVPPARLSLSDRLGDGSHRDDVHYGFDRVRFVHPVLTGGACGTVSCSVRLRSDPATGSSSS